MCLLLGIVAFSGAVSAQEDTVPVTNPDARTTGDGSNTMPDYITGPGP
jgi:hypothetical protein